VLPTVPHKNTSSVRKYVITIRAEWEGSTMRTTILACLIAFAGLVIIAAGVWDLSSLEAETGETLALSDYAPGVQTIADGLVMLGVAQALRLLLVVVKNTKRP
jgi:hypothetical protein